MKDLKRRVFKGFVWQFGGAIFKTVLQLFVLGLLARLISKFDFGVMQAAIVVIGFAKLISQMGVGPALVQKEILTEKHIRAGGTFTFFFSLVLCFTVYASSGLLAAFFKMSDLELVLKVVSIIFVLEGVATISQSLLLRSMKQDVLVKIDFLSYFIGYGMVAVGSAYYGYGLWSLVFGQLTQSLIQCVCTYFSSKHSIRFYVGSELKDLLYFGGGFTFAHFFNYIANQGDNLIAGRSLGADALGVYSRAYAIMVKPVGLLGDSLDKVLFPAMSARQGDREKLKSVFFDSSELILFLCLPVSAFIFLNSDVIIAVLLGDDWGDAVLPLQILSVGLVFRMGYKMGSIISKATGYIYHRARVEFIYAVCVLCFGLIGVPFGISGIATGTVFAIVVTYVLMVNLSLNILGVKWGEFIKRMGCTLYVVTVTVAGCVIVIYGTKHFFSSDIVVLIASSLLSALSSILVSVFFARRLTFLRVLPIKIFQI